MELGAWQGKDVGGVRRGKEYNQSTLYVTLKE